MFSSMRVLFVYPNLYTQMGFNHGLASLSAQLLRAGHETRLVNLNENLPPVVTPTEILDLVEAWQPGMLAFSCLSQQYLGGLGLARELRDLAAERGLQLPPLVVGGIHPTMVPREVMLDGVWDFVGVGECEDALLELVLGLESGEVRDDYKNFLCWRGGQRPIEQLQRAAIAKAGSEQNEAERHSEHVDGRQGNSSNGDASSALRESGQAQVEDRIIQNPVGEFPDFESLPQPDYELFDTQRILDQKNGWVGLITSRGCPYRCTYCLNHKVVDRYREDLDRRVSQLGFFRFRRPQDVVEEMRWVLQRYQNVSTFILDDDLFTQNAEHALAFCEAYRASGIQVPFVVNSHVKELDPRVSKALAESGCRILKLGIESGSRRVRYSVLQRPMSNDDILRTIESAESHRLHSSGFVMVGLPTETREERWETVDLLARSGIGRFRCSLFFPFPGTEAHRLSIEAGHVKAERVASLTDFTESSCLDFGAEENLFIDKLATCMPWFVNSRLDLFGTAPAAARYRPLVEDVLGMDLETWQEFRGRVREVDAEISRAATDARELHYAIRYNASMGVRSDFFLAEDAGIEWLTAAARPVPERLELALSKQGH